MPPDSPIEKSFKLTPYQKKSLEKFGIKDLNDLLHFFPVKYGVSFPRRQISELQNEEKVTVYGILSELKTGKTWKTHKPFAKATLADGTGKIKITWIHQPYIAKMFKENSLVKISGKVREKDGSSFFINPEIDKAKDIPLPILGEDKKDTFLESTYKETQWISSRWLHYAVQKVFKTGISEKMVDPLPANILSKYNLPALKSSLIWIHLPKKPNDFLAARKRFAFEEVFFIQLEKQRERKRYESRQSFKINKNIEDLNELVSKMPFKLTEAQEKAVSDIFKDFKRDFPMSRLLEGDVGSGKTAVAAITSYATITTPPPNNRFGQLQVTYMAPTEILANQHFKTFIELFAGLGIKVGLITGSGCKKFPSKVNPKEATDISKTQLLKWVANGEIPILIGTHALIEKKVTFKNLAYVIIDEQHRFGTEQRARLRKKDGFLPHLLTMTATPIPRTLALTIYGDLDLTLLDQMPSGRKPVITEVVSPSKRAETYEKIRKEIENGRQLYVICPRIDEPDPEKELALNAKSVTEEAARLKREVFPEHEIGILHGKLKKDEKEKAMEKFSNNQIKILCATSVVEVGVNVPNATMIIIEGAERFGLAQLHQLRGRVLRSTHQAYCFVFSDSKSKNSLERLKALVKAKNGFELAEFDLKHRGAGELYGAKQWGITDLGMEAIKNIKMVEAARNEARLIAETDPELSNPEHALLKKISESRKGVHFE